jgi:hypothetical protein
LPTGRLLAPLFALAALGLGLAGAAARVAPAHASAGRALCGFERWTVKTLQDRPSLLAVQSTTIAYLASRPAPAVLPNTRLRFERHVFRVNARVTLVRLEADEDFHLVLVQGAQHMIAESPAAACTAGATASERAQMAAARQAVRPCSSAVVTGVAFFDFLHGQTGVAPNGIELHPILGFSCLRP